MVLLPLGRLCFLTSDGGIQGFESEGSSLYRENSFRAQPQAGGRFYCLSSLTLQKLLNLSGLYIFLICELIKKTYKLQRIIVGFNEIAADASLIFITLMQMLTVASVLVLNLCDTELAASRFDRIMHPDFLLAGIHFSPQSSFLFIYTTSRVLQGGGEIPYLSPVLQVQIWRGIYLG